MNGLRYYFSGALFVILCLLDAFFGLMLLVAFSQSVEMVIGTIVFLLPLLFVTKKCYSWHKKIDYKKNSIERVQQNEIECEIDEPLFVSEKSEAVVKPNFEITYENSDGETSKRKIAVRRFDGKVLVAYCFMRKEERTFYIPRISECVDLSTGEIVQGDLRSYLAKKYGSNLKPFEMYHYDEWSEIPYKEVPCLPYDLNGFELNVKLQMKIVTYKDGERSEEFICGKIMLSSYDVDQFYIKLTDSNGNILNVGFSKIVSVDGIDDFYSYVLEKFYQSDSGKVCSLLDNYGKELSILIYLGRADASLTAKKRGLICEYMNTVGAECSEELLAKANRKIKVGSSDFKKCVNSYAKTIPDDKKQAFLAVAEAVVGGRAKSKPFGLAGLQYIESKIKV